MASRIPVALILQMLLKKSKPEAPEEATARQHRAPGKSDFEIKEKLPHYPNGTSGEIPLLHLLQAALPFLLLQSFPMLDGENIPYGVPGRRRARVVAREVRLPP